VADEHAHPDTESLLRRLIEVINNARPLPMSATVRITKDEVLEMLEDALTRLPAELREARWMLKERADFVAKTHREADEVLESARVRAERMVQRTEIVREAAHTAQRLVDDARDEATRLRLEAEDYCDQKLANFEIVLERLLKTAQAGREKLQVTPLPSVDGLGLGEGEPGEEEGFFDQDIR
jgi:regulator of protease activity HflC (stomatin/prohibitin superfamily)